jgi:cytochrome c556
MKAPHLFLLAALLGGTVTIAAVRGDEDQEPEQKSFWMEKKLESSQHILKGLATADFESISRSAEAMKKMTILEKLTRRTHADEYRAQLAIFQAANKQLIHEAGKKNIDGVALAYTQLMLTCVNCHKVLRDAPKL